MALSTAQALREWDGVLKMLVKVKLQLAANPGTFTMPASLKKGFDSSTDVLLNGLATPVATWKQLLDKKVPQLVLAACCELLATRNLVAATSAHVFAVMLLTQAAADLPQLAARAASSGSSSGSQLTAMLWGQIEQSGFLQQLPDALSFKPGASYARPGADHLKNLAGMLNDTVHLSNTFNVLQSLEQLQPTFYTSHAVGQWCVVPVMQLGLRSLQFISTGLAQAGRQEWMEQLLMPSWDAVRSAAAAAEKVLESNVLNRPVSSSSGSSTAVVKLLRAPQTTQWVCLNLVMPMLSQFLQQAADTPATPTSTSSTAGSAASSSSSRRAAAASSSRQRSRQPSTPNSAPGTQPWLPATLAPNMPAAYNSVLEQLGVSREVGLWLAASLNSRKQISGIDLRELWKLEAVCGMRDYTLLLQALKDHSISHPSLAALHMSASAAYLQWLSSMLPGQLSGLPPGIDLEGVCEMIAASCHQARMLIEQQSSLEPGQQQEVRAQFTAANQAVGELSAAVLEKLLGDWRSLPDSVRVAASTGMSGISSSSSAGGSSSSTGIMLVMSSQHMVASIADAAIAAVNGDAQPVGNLRDPPVLQLPFQHAQCCKVLQDCVRLAVPGAAAAADGVLAPFGSLGRITVSILGSIALVLNALGGGATSGPLAAAGGDVSSPDALQLFGLLCTLLKVYNVGIANFIPLSTQTFTSSSYYDGDDNKKDISTAVLAAVSAMLRAALGSGASNSSRACTAVLPCLVLLGRCCLASAVLARFLQGSQAAEGDGPSDLDDTWLCCRGDLTKNLQLLRSSLGSVVGWLAAADSVQQLAALGYQPQDLQQQLAVAAEALPVVVDYRNSDQV